MKTGNKKILLCCVNGISIAVIFFALGFCADSIVKKDDLVSEVIKNPAFV